MQARARELSGTLCGTPRSAQPRRRTVSCRTSAIRSKSPSTCTTPTRGGAPFRRSKGQESACGATCRDGERGPFAAGAPVRGRPAGRRPPRRRRAARTGAGHNGVPIEPSRAVPAPPPGRCRDARPTLRAGLRRCLHRPVPAALLSNTQPATATSPPRRGLPHPRGSSGGQGTDAAGRPAGNFRSPPGRRPASTPLPPWPASSHSPKPASPWPVAPHRSRSWFVWACIHTIVRRCTYRPASWPSRLVAEGFVGWEVSRGAGTDPSDRPPRIGGCSARCRRSRAPPPAGLDGPLAEPSDVTSRTQSPTPPARRSKLAGACPAGTERCHVAADVIPDVLGFRRAGQAAEALQLARGRLEPVVQGGPARRPPCRHRAEVLNPRVGAQPPART